MHQESNSSMLTEEILSQKLQIFISGRNLNDFGGSNVINSYVVVTLSEPQKPNKQVLKTKVIHNQNNPNFPQTLLIDFVFEVRQKLLFQIYHEAKPPKLIGRLQTSIGEIFGSPTNGFIKPLKNQYLIDSGKIILRCEKVQRTQRKTLNAQITAINIPNIKWWYFFGGTCPFYRIFRKRKEDQLLIYQSQVINYSTNPNWKQIKISEQKLNKLDEKAELQIRVYNFYRAGKYNLIGSAVFTLAQLSKKTKFPIFYNKKDKKGQIIFKNVKRSIKYSFGDYIQKGLQLALITCIDFTASNGNPENKDSLHFTSKNKKSPYEQAMSQVLDILLDYDYDKLVPCYGFGAIINHPTLVTYGKVSHCFPLNGNSDNPQIFQKQNIMKEYRQLFKYLKLSGPTKFSQLLKNSMQLCRKFQQNKQKTEYMILFILTDGQIHDKSEVIDLLIKCNRLPISIIIVGIGKGDFAIMRQLDDDNCQMMDKQGNKTERDLVQFVEFEKFKNNGIALAREVLEELPRQVQEYYELVGFNPDQIKRKQGDIQYQMMLSGLKI